MKNNYINETYIVDTVCEYLQKNKNLVYTEVQLFEKFIDIFCKSNDNIFIAVEAKVKSPTRAFEQASKYKYIADYVYVAVLKNKSNKTAMRLAEESGIGLMLVEEIDELKFNLEIVKQAIKSNSYIAKLANKIWETKTNEMSFQYG